MSTFTDKTYHFIGIGGIGMSALAEILVAHGAQVSGSDQAENANVTRLRSKGVTIHIGHSAENLPQTVGATVVFSTAIKPENPERAAAKKQGVTCKHRAEILAEILTEPGKKNICVTGTHGKTTTTALVFTLLEAGGLAPGIINGGVLASLGSNAKKATGTWWVAEADESDNSFTRLTPDIAVITNMEPEHMETFGGMEAMRNSYNQFLGNTRPDGSLFLCADDPELLRLATGASNTTLYGTGPGSAPKATNLRPSGWQTLFDVTWPSGEIWQNITLNLPGSHNVKNALAAMAVAHELGVPEENIRTGLANFSGVARRFNNVGSHAGFAIIDDYGHHPTEITAALQAARDVFGGKILAVIQPHRYSRLDELMEGFAKCAHPASAVVFCPVYAAGEAPLPDVDHHRLAEMAGHELDIAVHEAETAEEIAHIIHHYANIWGTGDHAAVFLGAGSISTWAREIGKKDKAA